MDALAHLGTLFEEEADLSRCQQEENSPQTPISWNMLSQESPFLSNASPGSQEHSQQERFWALSQSYYDLRESELEDESADRAFELSQRVERGEGVDTDGPLEALDDFINPDTLTPYKELEDAASDDEGLIEQELCAQCPCYAVT